MDSISCRTMDKICRVCMARSGAFTNIFDEPQKWDTCIADMIAECTGYLVRRGDSLPENICPPCLEDAVSAFNLKKTCEQNHKLHFTQLEKHREELICDNQEHDEYWEPSDSETGETKQFLTDAKIQVDKDVDHRFKCSLCPKSYPQKSSRNRHMKLHGERPFKCSDCSKSFTQKALLSDHSRTHTGERKYTCSYCSKTFFRSTTLRIHIRMHTGERPYQCSYCTMTFKHKGNLNHHIRRDHTGKIDQSSACTKTREVNAI